MFISRLKYVCKCVVVLVLAISFDVFLAWGAISVLSSSCLLESRYYYYIYSLSMGIVELCVVLLIIGIFGGKWIGKPSTTGFILSGIYYAGWYIRSIISVHRPNFDVLTLFTFLGLPLVIVLGGLTYAKLATRNNTASQASSG